MNLPPYVPWTLVAERLPLIFPEGTPNRRDCVRASAGRTVFAMIYIGAVEGGEMKLAPRHVYRMTDQQAAKGSDSDRLAYITAMSHGGHHPAGKRWYQDGSREAVRDESLRVGLIALGAVIVDEAVPTNSSKGRYTLQTEFAALFDPTLSGQSLNDAIMSWQKDHLSAGALMRVNLVRAGAHDAGSRLPVTFPNGETHHLSPDPSSPIAKAVIEVFAKRFLQRPAVLWLSESNRKVISHHDKLAKRIGLDIQPHKDLPDIILVDIGPAEPIIVFVEVVYSDGAITHRRQQALWRLTDVPGFDRKRVAFVSAYNDRDSPGFKKTVAHLAWRSFAWFFSEPDHVLVMKDGSTHPTILSELLSD